MDEIVKVFFFFLLTIRTTHTESNVCGNGQDEKTREFIIEEGKETRKVLKAEMDGYFRRLEESFNQKLLESDSRNLLKLESLSEKVDANQNKLTQMDKLVLTMSEELNKNLKAVESKILLEVATQSGNTRTNHEEVLRSFSNMCNAIDQIATSATPPIHCGLENQTEFTNTTQQQTSKIRTRVIVEKVIEDYGIIEFDGGANSDVLRKIWMLQQDRRDIISDARFVMEENQLGQYAHLTIWSTNGKHHLYNGTQGNWTTELKASGSLILVTLTMRTSPTAEDHPQFKLRFNVTRSDSDYRYASEVIRADGGIQTFSYPYQNAYIYPRRSSFNAVISSSNGRQFALILKYLDIPEVPNRCRGSLIVWLIKETPTKTQYQRQPSSAISECGQRGNTSELIGHSTVAIVSFYSHGSKKVGTGFRMEVRSSRASE